MLGAFSFFLQLQLQNEIKKFKLISNYQNWLDGPLPFRVSRGASRSKLTQGAALKRNSTSLACAKKLAARKC